MILASHGLVVLFGDSKNPARQGSKRVIAFDHDGHPLVVDDRPQHDLVRADKYPDYIGIFEDSYSDVSSMIPGGGWRIKSTSDDGTVWSEPIVAWGLRSDGRITPLIVDADGVVDDLDDCGAKYSIYHPESTEYA